jgi:hypothetical protein
MRAKFLPLLAVSLFPLACSSAPQDHALPEAGASASSAGATTTAGGSASDATLIAPEGLTVTPHPGGCGALDVVALTLRAGPSNGELYAALKNGGETPACSPAFSVQLFDRTEQMLGNGLAGLLVQRFYRLTDGSNTIAACVGPGDTTMVAITDLPADLALTDVARVEYWCNFWALDVVETNGLRLSNVRTVMREDGVAYAGALENGFDVALEGPTVAVFPLNRAGRPLGVARGQGTLAIPPGGAWDFETDTVSDAGVAFAAYPAGGP